MGAGNAVKIGAADEEIQPAFADALLVMGEQRLRNPELGCRELLADAALLAQ